MKILLWPARLVTLFLIVAALISILDFTRIGLMANLMAMASFSAVVLAILEWRYNTMSTRSE